jgi:hypothetical protein
LSVVARRIPLALGVSAAAVVAAAGRRAVRVSTAGAATAAEASAVAGRRRVRDGSTAGPARVSSEGGGGSGGGVGGQPASRVAAAVAAALSAWSVGERAGAMVAAERCP